MDSQTLLMKRLATASHKKIYPSISPKSEIQLRRTLLTTRLWNQVCRQQQNDWLVSQQEADGQQQDGNSDEEWAWFTDTIQKQQEEKSCDRMDHEVVDDDRCATRKRSDSRPLSLTSDSPRKRIKSTTTNPSFALCTPSSKDPPAGPGSTSSVLLSV
ncbi:hypothetical protein BC941DRAFT_410179 [Chlamydoabsidia padenii]|nr:hypothetical protein BC941DRAFT_410179 [Chlamydoabsidia padenii]